MLRLPDVHRSPTGCTAEQQPDLQANFQAWCSQHSILWQKCTMGMSATTGRCVLAAEDVAAGEVVVQVPDDMVLMAENSSIQALLEGDGLTKPADDALLEVQGLVIAVMYEQALGSASKWGPYFDFMPTDMSHMIVYWTEAELEELRGTAALDKFIGRVQHPADAPTRVQQLFEELVVPFVLGHERVRATLLGGSKAAAAELEEDAREKLWQAYLVATSLVASYSFVLGDDHYQGMVAVWDLLNHVTGAVNVRLHHDPEAGVLQMIATEAIPKGHEVVNCYGHLSSAELLRGYGYVEQHNSIKHVQVPTHFLIKAAAAAAAATEAEAAAADASAGPQGKRGRKTASKAAAAAAAGMQDSDADAGSSEQGGEEDEEAGGDDSQGLSSDGEDESSSNDGDEGSDEGSASEPDWELEDDEPEQLQQQCERQKQYWAQRLQQQQQQQGQGEQHQGDSRPKKKRKSHRQSKQEQVQVQAAITTVPSFEAATALIDDWEERWQLCFSLGLLPKNGVLQVPAGGLATCPGQLLAILLLLLAEAKDCMALAAASAAATETAVSAAAAAVAAAAAAEAAQAGKGKGKKQHGSKQQQQQAKEANGASSSSPEEIATAATDTLAFAPPGQLMSALQHLVVLMLSRYPTTLQQDLQQLEQQQQQQVVQQDGLPPRLAAAVVARSAEKEVWRDLQHDLDAADVSGRVMQQARGCLLQAVLSTAQQAAAKAGQKQRSCSKRGCSHKYHDGHCHAQKGADGSEEEEAAEKKQQRGKQQHGKKPEKAAGFSFDFKL